MTEIVAADSADRLAAAEAELAELRAQLDQSKSVAIKLAQAEQRIVELEAQATAAREAARQADIAKMVDSVRVPAFRAEIHALLDLATRASQSGQLVTFSAGDGSAAAADPVDVVKALVDKLNARAAMIFGEASLSYADRQWAADSIPPDVEIARLCQALISSGAARTMSEAREKLRNNPQHRELFARYAQATN